MQTRIHSRVTLVVVGVVLAGGFNPAQALPTFRVGEGGVPWNIAGPGTLPGGAQIRAVQAADGLTGAAQEFYTQQGSPFELVDSNIEAIGPVTLNGQTHDALLMEWNPANMSAPPENLNIAAWEYVYGVDPDLRGTTIHFSVGVPGFPPGTPPPLPPIWDISLELIDANGGSAGWFLPSPVFGWTDYWIDPDNPMNQSGFLYFEDPTLGFDLSQVVAIRLDEAGTTTMFPVNPGGTAFWDWNVWNHLEVESDPIVPEPATASLALLGLSVLVRRRRMT